LPFCFLHLENHLTDPFGITTKFDTDYYDNMAAAHVQPALRFVTLLTTGLATPLSIAMSVIAANNNGYSYRWNYHYYHRRRLTAWPFVFLPLAMTAAASAIALMHRRKHDRLPNFRYALLDLLAFVTYLGVLIPIWAVEVGKLNQGGFGLLSGYTTAPMIVNMFIHLYFFLINARQVWSWISESSAQECPHCHGIINEAPSRGQETVQRDEGYSLLRGEGYLDADADAVAYSDGRPSEDQIGMQDNDDTETKGKGAIKI